MGVCLCETTVVIFLLFLGIRKICSNLCTATALSIFKACIKTATHLSGSLPFLAAANAILASVVYR